MGNYTYGANYIKAGAFDQTTGEIKDLKELEVYQDTFEHTEADPTITKHYQQGQSTPKVTRYKQGEETIKFNIMDTSVDSLLYCMGGSITTEAGVKRWNQPKGSRSEMIKGLEIQTEDGSVIRIPRGSWFAKKSIKATEADMNLI